MKEDNKTFSNQTVQKNTEFIDSIETFHKSFTTRGPLSREVTIEEGLELFETFSEQLIEFNNIKVQLIFDQKLFDLPLSKYDKLS